MLYIGVREFNVDVYIYIYIRIEITPAVIKHLPKRLYLVTFNKTIPKTINITPNIIDT